MANKNPKKENLIPITKRTPRKRKEICRKGAEATNKLLAERKTLKQELLLLLSTGDTQEKISTALIEQAQKGNTKAFEIIRDTIEEKPKDNIQITGEVNNPFKDLSTEELRQLIKDD